MLPIRRARLSRLLNRFSTNRRIMTYKIGTLSFLLVHCCAVLAFSQPTLPSEFDREFQAGRRAAEQAKYDDAAGHFRQAIDLQRGKCSECFVWMARIHLAEGKLSDARTDAEKGLAAASSDNERARAQLYLGNVLSRQGELVEAESAFKAASRANSTCIECKFNLGFILLKESKDAEGVAVLKDIAPAFAGTPRGRELRRFIEDPSRVRKNYAPEFSARLRSGEEVNLDTLKGKVVLLDFWGAWCAPCRVSLPRLKDLAASLDPAKVVIISIDENDSRERWEQFVQANNMNWFQVYDSDRSLYRSFNVDGFPRYYVLSKDGIILAEFKGWSQFGEATIRDAIAQALKQ